MPTILKLLTRSTLHFKSTKIWDASNNFVALTLGCYLFNYVTCVYNNINRLAVQSLQVSSLLHVIIRFLVLDD
jgi:hypothetical protein